MKNSALKFLVKYRRSFYLLSAVLMAAVVMLPMMGCGVAAWITDAAEVVAVIGTSFASLSSFIAGLTGNTVLAAALATVGTWIGKVQTGLSDLSDLVSQYQTAPSTGLLGDIESALTDVQGNLEQDFSNLGLPASVLNVISGIAGLANGLLVKWAAAIDGVKTASTAAEFKAATAHFANLAESLSDDIAQFKAGVNGYLTAKTGDAEIDAALAKAKTI
jgi:hypothetical protein